MLIKKDSLSKYVNMEVVDHESGKVSECYGNQKEESDFKEITLDNWTF